jgi:hypothetical protein
MRLFVLDRHEDVTGTSGTGVVAEGVQFSDGAVAIRWRSDTPSTIHYDSIDDVQQVHGHNGRTEVRWVCTSIGGANV